MYDIATTAAAIDAQSLAQGWRLQRHSQYDIDRAITHFLDIYDADKQRLRRPLNHDEQRFITNERRLCALDFRSYWLPNYAYIVNWAKQPQRFTPNVAQQIVMDLWAEDEAAGNAILMQQLKARRLGVSTISELNVSHRYQFQPYSNCVVASADPQKTVEMAGMIKFCLEQQPWWLMPTVTKVKNAIPVEFAEQHSTLTIEAGNQFTGVARGSSPNIFHLSELCEWQDADELIDSALLPAIIDTPGVFGILESTGGPGWWENKWLQTKKDFARGTSRIRPVFLPWYVGTDIYPTETWLRKTPIAPDWIPSERTIRHAEKARAYVLSNPLLFQHLAHGDSRWQMPREQMWYREVNYRTAQEAKTLHLFLSQYCTAPETPVLTLDGWVPAADIKVGDRLVAIDEHAQTGKGTWRKMRIAEVTRAIKFTDERVVVTTSNGQIVVHRDHQFLARDPAESLQTSLRWVPASQLVRGMVIKYFVKPWEDASDSWLAGLIDGEGTLDVAVGRLQIAQNEGPVLDRLKRELTALGISFTVGLVDAKKSAHCYTVRIGKLCDVVLLLGRLKPSRLWPRLPELFAGQLGPGHKHDAIVQEVHSIGIGDLVGLTTTTGTLITDGYISHNCADEFEAFQVQQNPLIDQEILISYLERTREPKAVYTIVGPDIPPALVAPSRYYDSSKPTITIRTRELTPNFDATYQLIPLIFTGYPDLDEQLKLLIWEYPAEPYVYGIGVDCAEGVGQDNAVINVLREATPLREPGQVAEWVSNTVTAFQLWPLVMALGQFYSTVSPSAGERRQCRLAIETWTNGAACQHELQKRGWVNFHEHYYAGDARKPKRPGDVGRIGIMTNVSLRSAIQDLWMTCLKEEAIDIPSPFLVREITTLENVNGKAQAMEGKHDDRWMSLGFPLYSLHRNKPPTKQFTRKRVSYAPGLASEIAVPHPTWTHSSQASSTPFTPSARVIEPQPVLRSRDKGALARAVHRNMPIRFRNY